MGYVKALDVEASSKLLAAVSRATTDAKARSFDDFREGDAFGGRMYEVFIQARGDVFIRRFTFDSSGCFLEDHSENTVKQLRKSDADVAYRLLTPWRDDEEERLADQKEKADLRWGLFP
jgi:hypothetical protein